MKQGFNSLQAGNSYQTESSGHFKVKSLVEFQFPSSGKLLPNLAEGADKEEIGKQFQFPSSGKLLPNDCNSKGEQ